jgi:hypothetical protein
MKAYEDMKRINERKYEINNSTLISTGDFQ